MLTQLSFEEVIDDRIVERLDTLNQKFTEENRSSLNDIFDRLYKNLYTRDQLIDEYNQLSKNIQNVISNCAQCIHERYKYENDFVLIKDRICQSLGQVGFIQESLEHYRIVIESLENETERLENLLSHPQIAQTNQQKFQIFEQNQRVQLDRLMKENEQMRNLIIKEKQSIFNLQRDIERGKNDLEKLEVSLVQIQSEGKQIQQYRSDVTKRSENLRTTTNEIQQMENEFHQRLKLTKDQYRLAQKQFQSLINVQQQTGDELSKLTTKEKDIDKQIEIVQNQIAQSSVETTNFRNQFQNLRSKSLQLTVEKQTASQIVKRNEHQNLLLERERRRLENGQKRLSDRVEHLRKRLKEKSDEQCREETKFSLNEIRLEKLQRKLLLLNRKSTKLIEMNHQLEGILQEHRLIRHDENERLRQLKKISIEKQKVLNEFGKRFHRLSLRQRRLTRGIDRISEQMKRTDQIFDQSNRDEKRVKRILREKKTQVMKQEKQRAYLAATSRDFDHRIRQLIQRNQLMENELKNKIDQFHSFDQKLIEQNHDEIKLNDQKERVIGIYREEKLKYAEMQKQFQQEKRLAEREMKYFMEKQNQNQQLMSNIVGKQQQIVHLATRNKRRIDEHSLLIEKIRVYQMMNDHYEKESQQSSMIKNVIRRIKSLENENAQLVKKVRLSHRKSLRIITSHQLQIAKREEIHQMNQRLSNRPIIIRDSSMRQFNAIELKKYPILVDRLRKIIEESIHWRQKILWINQLYHDRIEQFQTQRENLLKTTTMIDRIRIASRLRQCQANAAERLCL